MYYSARIDNAGQAGVLTLVPAPGPGSLLRVVGYTFIAAGDVTVMFLSGATPKEGPYPVTAGGGASAHAGSGSWLFDCGHGEPLEFSVSGPVQVGGRVTYEVVRL